jgi:hypothetical protein
LKQLVTRLQQRQAGHQLTARVQRRLHERVLTAVVLTLTRGVFADALTLGPRRHVVVALTEERVWILDHAWPGTVGGVIADFDRRGTLLHTRRRPLARRHAIELSWPDSHGFVAGTIPASEPADLLIGHLAADELTHH